MKKKLTVAAVWLCMTLPLTSKAQPNLQWIRNYGGLNADKAYSVKQLPDSGYIMVGESKSNSLDVSGHHGTADSSDFWVARISATGSIIWQKSYGGSHNDVAVSVDLTSDGGFIIAGSSDSQDGDVTDHPNGTLEFEGGAGGTGGPAIYPGYPDVLTWVVKTDGAGNISWTKTIPYSIFTVPGNGQGHITRYPLNHPGTIIHTSDGGYLLSVRKEVLPGDPFFFFNEQQSEAHLIKLNSSGDITWDNRYPALQPLDFDIRSMLETADGYVMLASPFDFDVTGSYEINLVKIDFSGNIQSIRKYGGTGTDVGASLSATPDGGYLITGSSDSYDNDLAGSTNHGGTDYWAFKVNSAGDIQWSKLYGGSQDDIPTTVIPLADGNYVVSGTSRSDDQQVTGHTPSAAGQPANADIWLIKINGSNGDLIWSSSYGGSNDDTGSDLIRTSDGGMLVAGSTLSSFGSITNKGAADWLLIKLNEGCNTTPPVCAEDQHFCSNSNPTVANLQATGQNIKWYDIPVNGRPLPLNRPLSAAGAYYASQTVGGCESARKKVRVRVFTTPAKPFALSQRFLCISNPTVCNLRAIGQSLKWYSSRTSTTPLAATVPLHTGTYYVTQTVAGLCESERQAVCVTVVGLCNSRDSRDSRFKKVTGDVPGMPAATVYPNPSRGSFKLFLNTAEDNSKVTVTLTDVYGKAVWQKDCRAVNGAVQETIATANIAAGMYLVKYTSDGITEAIKVIIEK